MENIRSTFPPFFSLGIFLLLLNHANAEDRRFPWKNANLSPFEQWRSAHFCLNESIADDNKCSGPNHTLGLAGWLSFSKTEAKEFCEGPCFIQTVQVMHCIGLVHRDFKFATSAPLSFVQNKINTSCASKQAFNTNYTGPNSATSLYGRFRLPLISTFALIIATFTY